MFSTVVQPPILSIFSSASSDCLALFSVHTDPALPSDSFVHLLDDSSSLPEPSAPKTLIKPITLNEGEDQDGTGSSTHRGVDGLGLSISSQVLQIQSPTLKSGYIQCPPQQQNHNLTQRSRPLGIKLPWLHMQVRNMGREWCFEVGAIDQTGREGRIRCSTFQKAPAVRTSSRASPILHIPLRFPPPSSRPLTAWCTTSLHIPTLMSHFSSLPSEGNKPHVLPSAQYSHISFVKIYATCRLRRIWFTAEKPATSTSGEPWEFGLYSQ